jgi:hypothetical protein
MLRFADELIVGVVLMEVSSLLLYCTAVDVCLEFSLRGMGLGRLILFPLKAVFSTDPSYLLVTSESHTPFQHLKQVVAFSELQVSVFCLGLAEFSATGASPVAESTKSQTDLTGF